MDPTLRCTSEVTPSERANADDPRCDAINDRHNQQAHTLGWVWRGLGTPLYGNRGPKTTRGEMAAHHGRNTQTCDWVTSLVRKVRLLTQTNFSGREPP